MQALFDLAPVAAFFVAYWLGGIYVATAVLMVLAAPMLIGALLGLVNFVVALFLGPETRGVEMVPDLVIA